MYFFDIFILFSYVFLSGYFIYTFYSLSNLSIVPYTQTICIIKESI